MTTESRKRAKQAYYRQRADNIKEQVSVHDILDYYDIPIRDNEREVQFPCPLHGDGADDHYSGRAYPETEGDPGGHTYCWACHKSRDVIEWVRDKESVSFTQAMKFIEEKFDVDDVPNIYEYFDPNQDGGSDNTNQGKSKFEKEIESILTENSSVEQKDLSYIERKIDRLVEEKRDELKMKSALRMYYTYDKVIYDIQEENISPAKAHKVLAKLIKKINQIIQT